MSESWKLKFWGSIILILFSTYILVPSFFDVQSKIEESAQTNNNSILRFFPKKTINLGLDLRGGLYLELDVDLAKSQKNKLDLLSSQMEQFLKTEKLEFNSVEPNYEQGAIQVKADQENIKALLKPVQGHFEGVFDATALNSLESSGQQDALSFKLSEKFKQYTNENLLKQALESVRNRVDRYGVAEASVQLQGNDHIVVEVPGEKDPERVIDLIRRTGQLEFRLVLDELSQAELIKLVDQARIDQSLGDGYSQEIAGKISSALKDKIPGNSEVLFEVQRDPITKKPLGAVPFLVEKKAQVTGDMLKDAQVNVYNNKPSVGLTFDQAGSRYFGELTKNNVDKRLAIILDGMVSSAPRINEPILTGQAEISMGMGQYQQMMTEAEDLALILKEGALPSSMEVATKNIIGPSLGRDSIKQGLNALLMASLVVVVFMILYYRWGGLLANVALILNVLLIFAVMSFLQASLSLPGLAGIVLTIGMAVDANIIIFERMREEKRLGKTPRAIVESGYGNAMSAIIDSNLTTMISGIVLYQFGTGPIKGFATTLMIGILTTLFSAIVFTRIVYDYFVIKKKVRQISI